MATQHLDTGTVLVYQQDKWKRSGCSGFGQTSFSQVKNKIPFSSDKSAIVTFGLILSYNRQIERAYRNVQNYWLLMHYVCKVFCCEVISHPCRHLIE